MENPSHSYGTSPAIWDLAENKNDFVVSISGHRFHSIIRASRPSIDNSTTSFFYKLSIDTKK